jgi:hypothetical protein
VWQIDSRFQADTLSNHTLELTMPVAEVAAAASFVEAAEVEMSRDESR